MTPRATKPILMIVAAVALLVVVGMALLRWTTQGHALRTRVTTPAKVADRLQQYGPAARARLAPAFDDAGLQYPPARVTIVGIKFQRILRVYAGESGQRAMQLIREYPILAASGTLGPKLQEGDRQVPEGLYKIESLNPNSRFHLSLRVSYPNEFDRDQAQRDGRSNLGGDIMIHGGSASIGCLAIGDEAIEEVFTLVAETGLNNTKVVIAPVDFWIESLPGSVKGLPAWTDALYRQIRNTLEELP